MGCANGISFGFWASVSVGVLWKGAQEGMYQKLNSVPELKPSLMC